MIERDRPQRRIVMLAGTGGPPYGVDDGPAAAFEEESERRPGLVRSYLGVDRRTLYLFAALVVGAFLVTTLIYGAIFGFDKWASNMQRAGSLMVINYCPSCGGPVTAAGHVDAAGTPGGPP